MPHSSVLLHRISAASTAHNPHLTPPSTSTSTTTTPYHHHNHQPSSPSTVSEVEIPDTAARFHAHAAGTNQCSSALIQEIRAPIAAVWSIVRRFDRPQSYKHFVKTCDLLLAEDQIDVAVGCLRRVHVISGLPAATSTERLEILDDERHVISFSVVGGDHRLSNYRSVTTLHTAVGGAGEEVTVVVESYLVDTPAGNTKDETCVFVDTIVRCNLQSLAHLAENSARREIGIWK